jgi:hypothetical protein
MVTPVGFSITFETVRETGKQFVSIADTLGQTPPRRRSGPPGGIRRVQRKRHPECGVPHVCKGAEIVAVPP